MEMRREALAREAVIAHSRGRKEEAMLITAFLAAGLAAAPAVTPTPETVRAFERYVGDAEAHIKSEESSPQSFLTLPPGCPAPQKADLDRGELVVAPCGLPTVDVPGGLIHHWAGAILIPHATVAQVLQIVQHYNNLPQYYAPVVMASRLIERQGDDFRVFLRLREHDVISVVFDTDYDVHYGQLDPEHQFSFSRSTRVMEIADAGQPSEHALTGDNDNGFLWRLNSYWRFAQMDDGVIVECEAISLTRSIPKGFGWLVEPFLRDIPRESLRITLADTRDAAEESVRAEIDQAKPRKLVK
jgi:hypothetical protein